NSPAHRAALLEALGLGHLINITPPPETQVNHVDFDVHPPGQADRDVEFIFEINKMPTDAEITCRGDPALHLQVWVYNNYVKRAMVDDGAA
ncbi:hypothetical protein KI387_010984, partial [Taxus chinensis]